MTLQLGSLKHNRNFTYPNIEAHQNLKRIGWSNQDGQAGSVEMLLLDYQEPWPPCPDLDFLPMVVHPADVPWPAGSAPWSLMLGAVHAQSRGTASEQDGKGPD